MSSLKQAVCAEGISLRQAALISGFGVLIMAFAAPFGELYVYERLVVPGNIVHTTQNISAHMGLFLAGIAGYYITFVCDVIVAWSLYVLLIPVNRSLSLLAGWFRLAYAIMALVGVSKLVTVYRMASASDGLTVLGSDHLHAQIRLLLNSFQYEWGASLVVFGMHLGLLGYLVYRSGYIPRILGILLAMAGLGWVLDSLRPYLYPGVDPGFMVISSIAELIFVLWLLLAGWRIQDPAARSSPAT